MGKVERKVAECIGRIARGEMPDDPAMQRLAEFELAIDRRIPKTVGLSVPPSVLGRADEVIE